MATLKRSQYGKHRVRVLKLLRSPDGRHDVCELDVNVLLTLSKDSSFESDDNSLIVPTDTVRNAVNVLAHDHLHTCRHAFARVVGRHFLSSYGHVCSVEVTLTERSWARMSTGGTPHKHAFSHNANGQPVTMGIFQRGSTECLRGGLNDCLVMKTTASSFTGYHTCALTTLLPAEDRIFATRINAEWTFIPDTPDASLAGTDQAIREAMMDVFANTHSPSVQRTLFLMGEAVLAAVPCIESVTLRLPNVHFLNLDLSKVGRPNQREVFLPTDEPHGQIEATITR